MVETYLNIANAYAFLGVLDKGLEFTDGAIELSQQILSALVSYLDDPNLPGDQKESMSQQYTS